MRWVSVGSSPRNEVHRTLTSRNEPVFYDYFATYALAPSLVNGAAAVSAAAAVPALLFLGKAGLTASFWYHFFGGVRHYVGIYFNRGEFPLTVFITFLALGRDQDARLEERLHDWLRCDWRHRCCHLGHPLPDVKKQIRIELGCPWHWLFLSEPTVNLPY